MKWKRGKRREEGARESAKKRERKENLFVISPGEEALWHPSLVVSAATWPGDRSPWNQPKTREGISERETNESQEK